LLHRHLTNLLYAIGTNLGAGDAIGSIAASLREPLGAVAKGL